MENTKIHLGYYSSIVTNRKEDITDKELDELAEKKILIESIIIVSFLFGAIILFAALAEQGSSYY